MSIFIIYKAKDGWRWRLKASNGRTIAESGEAYKKLSSIPSPYKIGDALRNARSEKAKP